MAAYDPDCLFKDDFASFRGVERFKKNVSNLGALLSDVDLQITKWDVAESSLEAHWRFSGILNLPWKPRLAAAGSTTHVIDTDRGLVVEHIEKWKSEPQDVIARLLKPAAKTPSTPWEVFMSSLSSGNYKVAWAMVKYIYKGSLPSTTQQTLLQQLGDLEATFNSSQLLLGLQRLPHSALLGLLQDERTAAASENTVLAAVQSWLSHQPAAAVDVVQQQRLAAAIRIPLLEPTYLTTVLPRIPWLLDILGPQGLSMAAGAARGLFDPHAEPCLSNSRACGALAADWLKGPRQLPASCTSNDGPQVIINWSLPLEEIQKAFEEASRLAIEASPCLALEPGVSVAAFTGSLAVLLNADVATDDLVGEDGAEGGGASVLCSSGSACSDGGSTEDAGDEAADLAAGGCGQLAGSSVARKKHGVAAAARPFQGDDTQSACEASDGSWQAFQLPQGSWVKSSKCDTGFRNFFGVSLAQGQWSEAAWSRYLQPEGVLQLRGRVWNVR
eukprot:gene2102-2421_t